MDLPCKYDEIPKRKVREVREEYIKIQNGLCQYCSFDIRSKPPAEVTKYKVWEDLFPKHFFDHPIHLHHCHKTGYTVGAVHAYCNALLWMYHGE